MSDTKLTFTAADTGLSNFVFVLEPSENNGKTIFAPNERGRLKLYPGGRGPSVTASCGTCKAAFTAIRQTYTEYLAFRDSAEANVNYHIEKLVSALWDGTGSGTPQIYGSRLVLPEKTTGILKVTYETSYDIVDVTCAKPTYVLVTASSEGLSGDFLMDFTDGFLSDVYDKDVVITVRDACTRKIIPGATVYINGKYSGKTDSEGILRLGSMKEGTYSLKITKDGYQSTDEDSIRNDYFTVE